MVAGNTRNSPFSSSHVMHMASKNESSIPSITMASFRKVSIVLLAFFAERNGTPGTSFAVIGNKELRTAYARLERGLRNTLCVQVGYFVILSEAKNLSSISVRGK